MNLFDDIAAAQAALDKAISELERDFIGPRGPTQFAAQNKRALHDLHKARQLLDQVMG